MLVFRSSFVQARNLGDRVRLVKTEEGGHTG